MKRTILILLIITIVTVLGVGGWLTYLLMRTDDTNPPASTSTQTDSPSTHTFTTAKGVTISLKNWYDNPSITSPLTITGTVPGSWSFEASFPVKLLDARGKVIATATAHLDGDWMTDAAVPFSATLTFEKPTSSSKAGVLVIEKDNPSDLLENADSLQIPVMLD